MRIFGRPDSKEQGKLVISMDRCVVNCLPKDEIDSILGRTNIAIYTINYGIDLKNKEEPFKRNIMGNFLSADSRFTKLLDFSIKNVNVNSDIGYVFNNTIPKKYEVVDSTTESISSELEQVIFRMQVQMSSKEETYDRNYKKVFSVIAELGGYIKAMVILAFLYKPFLRRLYFIDIINTLYRVERNRPLTHVQINEEQADKIEKNRESQKSEGESGSFVLKEKDITLQKAVSENLGQKEVEDNRQPLNREASYDGFEGSQSDQGRRSGALQYTWMDWITVICPCMKTKKHKLLERVKIGHLGESDRRKQYRHYRDSQETSRIRTPKETYTR